MLFDFENEISPYPRNMPHIVRIGIGDDDIHVAIIIKILNNERSQLRSIVTYQCRLFEKSYINESRENTHIITIRN